MVELIVLRVYDQIKLTPEMVTVWASDNKQAKANWKCDLKGLSNYINISKIIPKRN